MTFATELTAAVKNAEKAANDAYKRAITTTFRLVIQGTPVDKGFAQGGWLLTNGEVLNAESPRRTSPNFSQLNRIADIGGVTVLSNNLPYIQRLEDGYSAQARNPNGMVRINVKRFPRLLKANYEAQL